jgi:F420-0:gamma-glutamyl ligase
MRGTSAGAARGAVGAPTSRPAGPARGAPQLRLRKLERSELIAVAALGAAASLLLGRRREPEPVAVAELAAA